jgi:hypothetical protein
MKANPVWISLVGGMGLLAASMIAGEHRHGGNVNISTSEDGPIQDCGQIRVQFDGYEAARAEQQLAAPARSQPLVMRMPASSGLYVTGADRRDVSIRACKAARWPEDLPRISVAISADGQVATNGPEDGSWLVYLLVEAPRGTSLDVEASNGPIALRGLSGAVRARTSNGPLSLKELSGRVEARAKNGPISVGDCSGELDAEASNGPISLRGGSGRLRLNTQNGPISVDLAGSRWDGAGLEAHAVNGPLSVRIPENYRSGTRIESAGHSPFNCRAAACAQARRTWEDESRSVEFGDAQTVVRLSTVNGPVSIRGNDE